MRPVSTPDAVRELDRAVIDAVGVPGVALMEIASRGVAEAIRDYYLGAAQRGVVVVCGSGNNGGDGYGAARWLHGWGVPVATWSLAGASRGDAAVMRQAARRAGVPEVEGLGGAGLIVDAVFGTGLAREVKEPLSAVLRAIADHPAPVVAVDVPSGLCARTGAVLGVAPPAARTVTFGRLKLGMLLGDGPAMCGAVDVIDIGLEVARDRVSDGDGLDRRAEVPEAADLAPLWPRRTADGHKGQSGHLLLVAGSAAMAGAAVLACRGALAAGIGVLTLAVPRGALLRLGALPPEVMVELWGDGDHSVPPREPRLERFTAIAAGPGLSGGEPELGDGLHAWLQRTWAEDPRPVIYDADALRCTGAAVGGPRVVTPHPGEAGRLLGRSSADVQARRDTAAQSLAQRGGVALLKGRHTLVAAAGRPLSFNPTGSPALATAGSGDVLAGVVGALLGRGVAAWDAARLGAWVHGAAGERLTAARSEGWTATDVAGAVPHAVEDLVGGAP